MSDPAAGNGATPQAETLQPGDADRIGAELSSITFEIEKKLTVPKEGGGEESAYMAEDKNKVATYNLLIKIIEGDTETDAFHNKIKKALVDKNTFEFSLTSIASQNISYLPITYTYTMDTDTKKETIYVYHIKNAKIESKTVPGEIYSVPNIFAIKATRQKTNVREKYAVGIFTPQQQQELIPLESTIMTALKELVGGYNNTGFTNPNIESQLTKLKSTWNKVGITFQQDTIGKAKEAIFALFDAFQLPNSLTKENISEDPLVKNLKRYKEVISEVGGSTAFKLNFTDEKYRADYLNIKNLIYNINGALIQSKIGPYVDSMIQAETDTNKKEKYSILRAYIPAINDAFKTEGGGAIAFTKTGYGLKRFFTAPISKMFGINKVQLNPAFNKQQAQPAQPAQQAQPAQPPQQAQPPQPAQPAEQAQQAQPAQQAQQAQPPQPAQPGGSIKYQQKRYKVHERDDGARYITLDKKKYTLKMSSKGTYITRDGKRQYL